MGTDDQSVTMALTSGGNSHTPVPSILTAIPCTGNTADQAVSISTVHIQLGAAKHLTRPLTLRLI